MFGRERVVSGFADRTEARLEGSRERRGAAGGQRQFVGDVGGGEIVGLRRVSEGEPGAMRDVADAAAEIVGELLLEATQQGRRHEIDRSLAWVAGTLGLQAAKCLPQRFEKIAVTVEKRARVAGKRIAQELDDRSLVDPQTAEQLERRSQSVGRMMGDRHGEEGAVHPAGARSADDIDPGPRLGQSLDVAVGGIAGDYPADFEGYAADPDRETDAAVHDDRDAQLLLVHRRPLRGVPPRPYSAVLSVLRSSSRAAS